jgi:hypothetical protein
MPPKVVSRLPTANKDEKPKRRKKKPKKLNEAQSQRMNELQVRMYEDSLLGKFISEGPKVEEYNTEIQPEELSTALKDYGPALARYCGHPDLVREFQGTFLSLYPLSPYHTRSSSSVPV